MKKIQTFANGEIEVEVNDPVEWLHEVGDFIEFEYKDWQIIEIKDHHYILR